MACLEFRQCASLRGIIRDLDNTYTYAQDYLSLYILIDTIIIDNLKQGRTLYDVINCNMQMYRIIHTALSFRYLRKHPNKQIENYLAEFRIHDVLHGEY